MRVVGVTHPLGAPVTSFDIDHGCHPRVTLFDHGYVPVRPLAAVKSADDIVFTWLVREVSVADQRPPERHTVYVSTPDETPRRYQRIGAYALVVSQRGILGTVNSRLTGAPGTWALPGGGVDPDESPADAVLREIYEETGQEVVLDRVLSLESEHWVGRSLAGRLEDFHALRVVYGAICKTPSDPVVHDVGGSTERADWVPARAWRKLHWTNSSRNLLAQYARKLSRPISP
ncbi:NUDIX hydrolase [Tessaracoccus flavus]|jgi:8-oxo-dGTP pyrophosphatase MutT (NUDIX family)|uniref:NUDIX hydrolase n=1 Tax=Tessaracoccus flavus TaxID=1610493 RepID=UPI000894DCDA|nr:NUDIX domain-containing protein [Tessaracoccus flavus]SDY53478.1 ADP-ribose pyrophosphatase YjhB, NUDIX family [Tessaracoccus flavus]